MAKLIHIAKSPQEGTLYLRKEDPRTFRWFKPGNPEIATDIAAQTASEALRLARRAWPGLQLMPCGLLLTLPEREEHGIPAMFWQMAASSQSSNGIYFDEELGHNCWVHNIPINARKLAAKLKSENLL